MNDWVQIGMLGVQTLGLVGLVCYTLETRKIRKAAQEQVRVSQDLSKAATDQVEGLSKPCITIWQVLRDPMDTILEAGRVPGSTVAGGDTGFFVIQNIGNGVALNVSYRFHQVNNQSEARRVPNERSVQTILAGERVTMVEAHSTYSQGDFQIIFNYQSIGGRKYRSTVRIANLVPAPLVFETLAS